MKNAFLKKPVSPPLRRGAKRAFSKKQATTIYWKNPICLLGNWKCSYFGRQGSKLDDLATDREISTRYIDLRLQFDFVITRSTCVWFWRVLYQSKEESQGFRLVQNSSKMDPCSKSYDDFETTRFWEAAFLKKSPFRPPLGGAKRAFSKKRFFIERGTSYPHMWRNGIVEKTRKSQSGRGGVRPAGHRPFGNSVTIGWMSNDCWVRFI